MGDTQHFNYTNQRRSRESSSSQQQSMINDDPQFPSLGSKDVPMNGDHNDSKDISNDEDNNGYAAKSWVEHDEAGMDEDEENGNDNQNNYNNGQQQRRNNKQSNQRNRGKREQQPRTNKVWKAKS